MWQWSEEQGWRRPLAISFGFVLIAVFVIAGAMGVAAGVALTGLLAIPSWTRLKSILPLELPMAIFLVFIAWAWISMRWTTYPQSDQAWKMALGVLLYSMFAFAVFSLRGKARLLVLYVAAASLALILLVYFLEAAFGVISNMYAEGLPRQEKLRDATRGISALVIAAPCAWAFSHILMPGWRGNAIAVSFGLIAFWISWRFDLSSAMLALFIAGILFALGWFFPRTIILLVGLAAVFMFMLAPIVAPIAVDILRSFDLPLSWEQRVDIWQFASERIAERPMIGWGLDASRSFDSTYILHKLEFARIPLHPHNVGLQLWLETGLIGAILFSTATIALAIRVSSSWNLSRLQGATISASSSAILVFSTLTYGAWQEWFWASAAWVAAMCFLLGPPPDELVKS